jgi:hypothetical protein
MKNKHAVELGRMAAGKPKHYSKAELAKRTVRLRKAKRAYDLRRKDGAR